MDGASLLSLPEGMIIKHIQITEHGLVIEVEASHPTSCCPLCAQPSDSIRAALRKIERVPYLYPTLKRCAKRLRNA